MAIPVEENVLLFFLGAVFIPFISLLVKLLIDMGVLKSKVDQVNARLDRIERDDGSRR